MLARHLLFIATRRHNNTLLAIDSVPPHEIVQPPPYISPPNPEECQKDPRIQEILKDSQTSIKVQTQNEKQQQNYELPGSRPQIIYAYDSRQNHYDNNTKFFERNKVPNYNEYQRSCEQHQIVHMHNAKNQQYYAAGKDSNQQFYTLPSRRPQRDIEPPRSVTPDITRGLGRGSFNTMHMLAIHGQKAMIEQDSNRFGSHVDLNKRNSKNFNVDNRLLQNQQQTAIVDVRNRFTTPLGLTALGYRFFASSPVHDLVMKSPSADVLKHNPISPIGRSYDNSFKSSTAAGRTMPTVAERLTLTTNNSNCSLSLPNSGRSTPVQMSSGRSTPTNLVLSPTRSTMSNEELFAAIHKSKKRLNLKNDSENMSPYGSTNSLVKVSPGSRHSWSSEPQKLPPVAQNVQSPAPATSRLDFKRLLLQQSVKTGPTRLSAAEQLKLSRQQCQQVQSSTVQQATPLAKVLSPRSAWRFQTPRTDVLSSTIIEDTAAEEKAMKPSPENTSPIARLNARRQLDLCSDLPEHLRIKDLESKLSDLCNDRLTLGSAETSDCKSVTKLGTRSTNVRTQDTTDDVRSITPTQTVTSAQSTLLTQSEQNSGNSTAAAELRHSSNCTQLTLSCQKAISAFESRRISNQLARAQFLASTPTSTNQSHNTYVRKIFRARSESPQNSATQNVSRSPSAPTLETAL